jgi:ATP-dependent Clp protease ATP-binding subunit ClpC
MFEKYSDSGRRAVITARKECDRLGADAVRTEHLLLAITMSTRLVISEVPVAVSILEDLNISIEELRKELEGDGSKERLWSRRELPFTPNARRALELANELRQDMGHQKVNQEHILLGILSEKEGRAGNILRKKGITSEAVIAIIEEKSGG